MSGPTYPRCSRDAVTSNDVDQASAAVLTPHWRVVRVRNRNIVAFHHVLFLARSWECSARWAKRSYSSATRNSFFFRSSRKITSALARVFSARLCQCFGFRRMLFDMTNSLMNIRTLDGMEKFGAIPDHGRLLGMVRKRATLASRQSEHLGHGA